MWVLYHDSMWTILGIQYPFMKRGLPHMIPLQHAQVSNGTPFPPALSKASGHREAGGTCDMMFESHGILLQQHLEHPSRDKGIIAAATLKKKNSWNRWHKRKGITIIWQRGRIQMTDSRMTTPRRLAEPRNMPAQSGSSAFAPGCVSFSLFSYKSLSAYIKTSANRNISSWNIPWMHLHYPGR